MLRRALDQLAAGDVLMVTRLDIHLIYHHWPNLDLLEVWTRVQKGDANLSNKIHLRFQKNFRDSTEQDQIKRRSKIQPRTSAP